MMCGFSPRLVNISRNTPIASPLPAVWLGALWLEAEASAKRPAGAGDEMPLPLFGTTGFSGSALPRSRRSAPSFRSATALANCVSASTSCADPSLADFGRFASPFLMRLRSSDILQTGHFSFVHCTNDESDLSVAVCTIDRISVQEMEVLQAALRQK